MYAGWAGQEGWEQSHYPTGTISQGPQLTKVRVVLDKFTISALVRYLWIVWVILNGWPRQKKIGCCDLQLIICDNFSIIHQQEDSRARVDRDKGLVVWKTHWFYFSSQTEKQQKPLCLTQQKAYMYYKRNEDVWIKSDCWRFMNVTKLIWTFSP